jgi:hypothetical protein
MTCTLYSQVQLASVRRKKLWQYTVCAQTSLDMKQATALQEERNHTSFQPDRSHARTRHKSDWGENTSSPRKRKYILGIRYKLGRREGAAHRFVSSTI